jgi:hypothetical protein
MNKQVLAASVALGFAIAGSVNAAPIEFAPTGAGGASLTISGFEMPPTSFLGAGVNAAILNFVTGAPGPTTFQSYISGSMESFTDPAGNTIHPTGMDRMGGFELTAVMGFTSRVTAIVTNVDPVTNTVASNTVSFSVVPDAPSFLRLYYDNAPSSFRNYLSGSGFNNGRLIASSNTVGESDGSFTSFTTEAVPPELLDLTGNPRPPFPGQLTVSGNGGLDSSLTFSNFNSSGGGGVDPTFFRDYPTTDGSGLTLSFDSVSEGLPFSYVSPSDCFTRTPLATQVGSTNISFACDSAHVNGLYSAQGPAADVNGKVPNTGLVNGDLSSGGTDLVAETDFSGTLDNTVFTEAVPEPGSIVLVVLGLGALGLAVRRRPQVSI